MYNEIKQNRKDVSILGKFVIKQAKTGYKFNLHAANGEIIAVSQIYSRKHVPERY
jgi:uncharacterized protein YegP (UPF0339 family)